MKYELDTIPVWDALKADTECLLCLLERRSRNSAIRYYLGPSVMVPEVRVEVNKIGFCADNTRLLAKDQNKLGLALITHTRLKKIHEDIQKKASLILRETEKVKNKNSVENLLTSKTPLKKMIEEFSAYLKNEEQQCLINEKIDNDLNRFAFTLIHLWLKDHDFKDQWNKSKGICLHHTPVVLAMAENELDAKKLGDFLGEYLNVLTQNLARVENDILSFTQTFDATQSHEITGKVEGALERSLQKLMGAFKEYEDEAKSRKGPLMGM